MRGPIKNEEGRPKLAFPPHLQVLIESELKNYQTFSRCNLHPGSYFKCFKLVLH